MGLTIGRKKGESVIIKTSEGDIEIMALTNQTKLNITAPKDMGIWRKELLDENNQLPAEHRHPENTFQERGNLHIREDQSVHPSMDQKTDQTQAGRPSVAETKKNGPHQQGFPKARW